MAYASVEPFGEKVEWLRAGVIASVIANVNRPKNKKAFKPEDFVPQEPQSMEEQKAILQGIFNSAKKAGFPKRTK